MGFRISTNVASINAQRSLNESQMRSASSMAQLSSGSRINKAADDAAGLAISEGLKGQIRSTRQANRNAQDGISLVQTAEGGLNEIGNIVVRLRELGVQAASDTVGDTERGFINKEVQQLKEEMQRISNVTTWGKTKLLDGSSQDFDFQIGTYNNEKEDRIKFSASENTATLDALGVAGIDFTSKEGAQSALEALDNAQTGVSSMRANLGALQSRLNSTVTNLSVSEENMAAANSRIRDTDVAAATAEMTRNNIMLQASTATLSQANSKDQLALKLIG
jgi:flagellin